MRRREFIAAIRGVAVFTWSCSLAAQPKVRDKPFRIVTLPDIHPTVRDVFLEAMHESDRMEGRDFVQVMSGFQWGVMDGLASVVRRLIAEDPDLFFVGSDPHALAVHRASTSIPIIMSAGGYPIKAKPGIKRISLLWTYLPPALPAIGVESPDRI